MSKIYGDEATIKRAQEAKPGDSTVVVNWDAIKKIPPQFEIKLVNVKFDPFDLDKFFTNVGTIYEPKYYPHIDFMYKIAGARGVIGSAATSSIIYEDVEIDEMDMTTTGKIMKRKKVGYEVKKSAHVLEEDGTILPSGERISNENAWEECLKAWHKEEKATEGYSSAIVKDGEYTYYKKKYTGKHIMVRNGEYLNATPLKYDTKWKRKCHFDETLDKALGKADSKSKAKAIREVVGLPTSFLPEDLVNGSIIVSRVYRSREILQAEAAANLTRITQGGEPSPSSKLLFGSSGGTEDLTEREAIEALGVTIKDPEPEPVETNRDKLIKALEYYQNEQTVELDEANTKDVKTMLKWLKDTPEAETNDKYWEKAIGNLKKIEKGIPEFTRFNHGLVLTD